MQPTRKNARTLLVTLALLGGRHASSAQSFAVDSSSLPIDQDRTENLDFGDADLDGDWDVFLGQGGEQFPAQNGLWINQGGLQGAVLGTFVDESSLRLPPSSEPTMDIDLGDVDGDGDLDVHLSNTSLGLGAWGSSWWINVGGDQQGQVGFFVDETASRWVGLGQPGSSIPMAAITANGTFDDYCGDSDFGDLDGDGDLDLVHSSYREDPVRVFLNDGNGYFSELNPSGTVVSGIMQPGQAGLWCEGLYQPGTTDATGSFCDIVSDVDDLEIGDIDGDFDLDLLVSNTEDVQRVFANRTETSGLAPASGTGLLFRDVSSLSLTPGSPGSARRQQLSDLDGDGDLDFYGVNWSASGPFPLDDDLRRNDGGVFTLVSSLPGTAGDNQDVEFLDYDADGDLDAWVTGGASWTLFSQDGNLQFSIEPLPPYAGPPFQLSLDSEAADIDGDGDTDVVVAQNGSEELLLNITGQPDNSPPRIPSVESHGAMTAGPGTVPVRAHVYDNSSNAVTWFLQTDLEIRVDGIELPPLSALSSHGQVFRAELPANLVGAVDYRFVASDETGNTGASVWSTYPASYGGTFSTAYGAGTVGLSGGEPRLRALSVPFGSSTFYLALSSGAPPGSLAVLGIGTTKIDPPLPIPGLVQLAAGGSILGILSANLDLNGNVVLAIPVGPVPSGVSTFAQGFVVDPTASGDLLASSAGLEIITP